MKKMTTIFFRESAYTPLCLSYYHLRKVGDFEQIGPQEHLQGQSIWYGVFGTSRKHKKQSLSNISCFPFHHNCIFMPLKANFRKVIGYLWYYIMAYSKENHDTVLSAKIQHFMYLQHSGKNWYCHKLKVFIRHLVDADFCFYVH